MSENENFVSYEEQLRSGLVPPPRKNFVSVPKDNVRVMTPHESAAFGTITQVQPAQASQRREFVQLDNTHSGHVRHDDNPVINAQASLLYSAAYIAVFFMALLAMLIITDLADGDGLAFFGILIGGTSIFALGILAVNRAQGLKHSATGIAHAEVKTRVQMNDRNAQVDEYQIDADKEVKLAEVAGRVELGKKFLDQMSGGRYVE